MNLPPILLELVEKCFSEDESQKSGKESMDPITLEVVTAEANLMAHALMDDGYGGVMSSDITALANALMPIKQVHAVNVPTHLSSYNRSNISATRSVDFNLQNYQGLHDGDSIHSDAESTLGESRTTSQAYLRDIQAITAQVIAHFSHGNPNSGNSVPSPAATSHSSSSRFIGGGTSGQGR